jgi:hypothetical protein
VNAVLRQQRRGRRMRSGRAAQQHALVFLQSSPPKMSHVKKAFTRCPVDMQIVKYFIARRQRFGGATR